MEERCGTGSRAGQGWGHQLCEREQEGLIRVRASWEWSSVTGGSAQHSRGHELNPQYHLRCGGGTEWEKAEHGEGGA